MSKKKIILITVISILVIALIAGIIIYMVVSNGLSATPIIEIVNDKLMNSDKYVFETTYNDENRTYLAKSGETAYVDSFYDGIESKYVVRDGNTYLLIDDTKTYYTYENNTTDHTRITSQFTSLSEQEPTRGKEKIDGIVFLTAFPCGLDSLVNELVMRKIDKPYLNLVIDDLDSLAGMETRIESFVDIIEQA